MAITSHVMVLQYTSIKEFVVRVSVCGIAIVKDLVTYCYT